MLGLVWKPTSRPESPSFSRAGSPRGILPRGAQHETLEACYMGFSGPCEPDIPVESHPAYGHRGEVPVRPSLVSLARLREVEAEVPPPPPALDLLLQPRDDSFSSAGVPAASSFASGDFPLPVPSHLLAPMLGFLLSSHLFLYILFKKIRGQEQEEILAWVQWSGRSDTHAPLHSP